MLTFFLTHPVQATLNVAFVVGVVTYLWSRREQESIGPLDWYTWHQWKGKK